MVNFKSIRKSLRRIVHTAHVALICTMVAYSPMASSSVQITLGTAMKVRSQGGSGLDPVAVLAKGSVVEIPDAFKIKNKDGSVNASKTFNNWLKQAGYTNSQIKRKSVNQFQDYYYPVKVVSVASKSSPGARKLVGRKAPLFMALRVLERSNGGLRVKESSRAYSGSGLKPVRGSSSAAAPARSAPRARPAAPSAPASGAADAEAPSAAPAFAPSSSDLQVDPPPAPAPVQPVAPPAPVADPAPSADTPTEAQSGASCPQCDAEALRAQTSGGDQASELGAALPAVFNGEARGMQGLPSSMNARCSNFIQADGSYGAWGQYALREINRWNSDFMNARGMGSVCPNFNSFNDAQKRHFWVYLMTSIAAQESTCDPNIESKDIYIKRGGKRVRFNPNGIATGLFQIEKDPDLRAGRNAMYGGNYCSGNPKDPEVNTRCAAAMLQSIIDDGNGPYTRSTRYWSVLLDSHTKTKSWISQYDACGAAPVSMPGKGKARTHKGSKSKKHPAKRRHK